MEIVIGRIVDLFGVCFLTQCLDGIVVLFFARLPNIYVFKDLPPQGVTTPHDTMEWMDPQTEDAGWMLAFIIPPLDQKKKNRKVAKLKSELVGAHRHKCYYR
jgi:hypothetical protein